MTKLSRKIIPTTLRCRIHHRMSALRRCLLRILHKFLLCSGRKPSSKYRMLPLSIVPSPSTSSSPAVSADVVSRAMDHVTPPVLHTHELDSDLVPLKISLLGDCQIGKTSFLMKYTGDGTEEGSNKRRGSNPMDKTLFVKGARISYRIWEVEGDGKSQDQISMACKDSVAILIMFDLTSRCTLNSVLGWYKEARKHNQTAIPVLIGTKFDDFIQLPIDLQWTIASQARTYARALNATLFFSSATYNINVNKIFKFITAKLFDLPWTVERNVTIGEPIIDF